MVADLKTLSIRFIRQVESKVSLKRYDKDEWFKGAYSTIQRTLHGGLSDNKKDNLKKILFDTIEGLQDIIPNEINFDKWFVNIILKIKKEICLSFGQAQKIINILMKYHFCYYYSSCDNFWKTKYHWLCPFFMFFHVPIDNILLFNCYVPPIRDHF